MLNMNGLNSLRRYNLEFFRRLWSLLKPYWVSEEKKTAWFLLFLITLGIVLQVVLNVMFNDFYRVFYDAIQHFDGKLIATSLVKFCVLLFFYILIVGYYAYFIGQLIIRWRRWLTKTYLKHWFAKDNFYRLEVLGLNVDNPDQRISEDLDAFPQLSVTMYAGFLNALLNLVTFSIILWNISGGFTLHLFSMQLVIPGYLFWIALVYAAVGTYITARIGQSLASLNYMQQQYNANFRFGLVHVREYNEQIALFHGEKPEQSFLRQVFSTIFDNYIRIIKVTLRLNFFRNGYNVMSNVVGLVAAMPLYLSKKIELGGLTQTNDAFWQVNASLSFIINSFTDIANWYSVIFRLTEFEQRMYLSDEHEDLEQIALKIDVGAKNLQCKNILLYLPTKEVLLENFNLTIQPGEHLLIMGESGSGKSTLLRLLAGIWPYGSGEIILPKAKKLFLPQKPYFPIGTLKAALCYPSEPEIFSDEEVLEVLKWCEMGVLESKLLQVNNWSHELSLGEQQLLAFARVILQAPAWVFLDEATSALDELKEKHMYDLLKEKNPHATVVSVGHRKSLMAWHQRKLTLVKGGKPSEENLTVRPI